MMKHETKTSIWWCLVVLVLALLVGGSPPIASAQGSNNTLHDFCVTNCPFGSISFSGGTLLTTTDTTNLNFGVTRSPDSNSGATLDITLVVLIPTSVVGGNTLSFTVSGTNTGNATGTSAFQGTWTGSDLITGFLALTKVSGGGGPSNPFSSLGGGTLASGYYVYTVAMGSVTFGPGTDPTFIINTTLPAGTVVLSYVTCTGGTGCTASGDVFDDTAPSEALLVSPVPEPASMALFGSGLAFIGGVLRRRLGKK